ncbi:MAG TPA: cyclic nucleotide-binding domain-containing protein [Deltaproteobacteria bacterium]|nr:cyclic nucleotide-binding domain-containing protein [Deltaproteobacteria bacterium]
MSKITLTPVSSGIYWLEVAEADLRVLCGCPADSVKHLMKRGLIDSTEVGSVHCETGPNAILLSDRQIQNGSFANLAEFPVLQMLYRQGMLLPGHPNNTGAKPILIGRDEVVRAQMDYIYRGNYGLTSVEEILETGLSEEQAEEMMRLKLRFAFGTIHPTEDLLEARIVGNAPVEVRNGVTVARQRTNRYEFTYQGEQVLVDLNLPLNRHYETPYDLGFHTLPRDYFSIVHTGEGDGWDINRPCMASILVFQGRIYLIDAGPNIDHSLNALGVDINEVEGIFHTHAHDDHFSGLTTLIRTDHRLKYYSTRLVRESVSKKLAALMSVKEQDFEQYFEIHDLDLGIWNNIDGLEVRPIFSPHPVETNIFFFRTLWSKGYLSYAHLADIPARDVLEGMVTEDSDAPGLSNELFEQVWEYYRDPADLKKIDMGGGLIHGKAVDFEGDESKKIVLSHTDRPLTESEQEIGVEETFGSIDVLIPGNEDYLLIYAENHLKTYYPTVPHSDLIMLVNCERRSYGVGETIIPSGVIPDSVHLLLTGTAELIKDEFGISNPLSSASLIGDLSVLSETPTTSTYRARSPVETLAIPRVLFHEFILRNQILEQVEHLQEMLEFMHHCWLLQEMISYPVKIRIARHTVLSKHKKGDTFNPDEKGFAFLKTGKAVLWDNGRLVRILTPGDFWGVGAVLGGLSQNISVEIVEDVTTYRITNPEVLRQAPILRWKLLEKTGQRS